MLSTTYISTTRITVLAGIMALGFGSFASAEVLKPGNTLCKNKIALESFEKAKAANDQRGMDWLLAGACFRIFNDTEVVILEETDSFLRVQPPWRVSTSMYMSKQVSTL